MDSGILKYKMTQRLQAQSKKLVKLNNLKLTVTNLNRPLLKKSHANQTSGVSAF